MELFLIQETIIKTYIYEKSKDNGANVNQWTYNGGAWQLFNFEATSK